MQIDGAEKKYTVIYADPPWSYQDKALDRGGAERHYRTMATADICRLPVSQLAANDSLLFMWGCWPKLFDAEKVIDAWGFTFKTVAFVWVKSNPSEAVDQAAFWPSEKLGLFWGMGSWTRANTEFCLLATKGKPKRSSAAVHQVIHAPVGRHSAKPDEARRRIVQLAGDVPRLELFARNVASGWDGWGNEYSQQEEADNGR